MPNSAAAPYRFAILLAMLLAVSLSVTFIYDFKGVLGDPDSFWHVKLGSDILASGHLPTIETYSYTFAGHPFVSKEWLSEVLFALSYRLGSWNGVMVLTALASVATLLVMFREFARYLHPTFAGLLAVLISPMLNPIVLARPHVLTMVVAVYFTARLFRAAEAKSAPPFWTLALITLWANLHGSFTLGFVVAAFAFLHLVENVGFKDKSLLGKWVLFGVLCPVAAMIHPYGYQPILIGANMMATNTAMEYIKEWLPLNVKDDFLITYYLLASLAALIGARLTMGWAKTLFIVFVLYMMLTHTRFVYVYFLLVPIVIVPDIAVRFPQLSIAAWRQLPRDVLERFGQKWFWPAAAAICIYAAVAGGLFVKNQVAVPPEDIAVEGALKFASAQHLDGPVFNDYQYGGSLIFHGIKTFIDGRAEQLFTGDFFTDYANSGKHDGAKLFKDILDRNKVTWTLLQKEDQRNGFLEQMGWSKAYSDEKAVIYTKPAA